MLVKMESRKEILDGIVQYVKIILYVKSVSQEDRIKSMS